METTRVVRPRAVVKPPLPNLALAAFAENVEQKMTNNPNFSNTGTLITELTARRTTLAGLIQKKSNEKGVAEALAAARRGVIDQLTHVKDFVNGEAEKAPPDQAKAIIESSGLKTKKVPVHVKLPLEIKYGGVAGAVLLVAAAVARSAVYYFEYSSDGKSWVACPNSWRCKTSVTGLAVGTTYSFRFRAESRKGLGDWSQVVTFTVR
jgi:hypothetical protein